MFENNAAYKLHYLQKKKKHIVFEKKKSLSIRFNVKPAGHMCFNVIMSYILHVRKN